MIPVALEACIGIYLTFKGFRLTFKGFRPTSPVLAPERMLVGP
jgi:hypothetical protein